MKIKIFALIAPIILMIGCSPAKRTNYLGKMGYSDCSEIGIDDVEDVHLKMIAIQIEIERELSNTRLPLYGHSLIQIYVHCPMTEGLFSSRAMSEYHFYTCCTFWEDINNKTVDEIIERGLFLFNQEIQESVKDIELEIEEIKIQANDKKISQANYKRKLENLKERIVEINDTPFMTEYEREVYLSGRKMGAW